MKDILIISHFTQVPGEKGNGRFHYIANKINKSYACVEIVTTNFSHGSKTHRNITYKQMSSIDYKLTMLYEPGYTKNISFKRLYSHYVLGRNLKKYLKSRKRPDVIYCSVPSLDVAKIAAKYAKEHNIRFILDIQDIWPEAFKMAFNIPVLSDVLFYPMKRQANYIYKAADEIIAVSQTYLNIALKANKRIKTGIIVYLGTDLKDFDLIPKSHKDLRKPKDEVWLVYIGTLGHSYDLVSVIDALTMVKDQGIDNIRFIVMGDGPLRAKFEKYAKEKNIPVEFTGKLSYGNMAGILKSCDIAINPIKKGSAGSIINKVCDYAAAGLPVINTQECEEYKKLLIDYNAGLNCVCEDSVDISKKICDLYKDPAFRRDLGVNNRRLAEDKFDRRKSYDIIINKLINGEDV